MNKPLISVLMSAYNAQKFIKVAIDSILNQTYPNFEFIIINDGSTDDTRQIIKSFTDDRIVLIDKKKNAGLVAALNDGIEIAKGEYIARMDADDESLPQRFELQIEFMQGNPNIDVLGTAMLQIDSRRSRKINMPKSHQQCINQLITAPCVFHPTVIIRKSTLGGIRYDEQYANAEDYKLWVDLAKNGAKFANLQKVLFHYHTHGSNISIVQKDEQTKSAKMAQKEYLLYVFNGNFKAELDLLFNGSASIKGLGTLYNASNKNQKQLIMNFFRRYIRDNINSIKFSWNANFQTLIYYFRYKIKAFLKK